MSKEILVEVSAHHVHVTDEDLETLFGKGHALTPKKYLSQPGQYAAEEKVVVKGPKGEFKASILGPTRSASQVEVSLTDARALGVVAMVRESGDVAGSNGITLVGPAGTVELKEGLIAAKRHIHMTPADAAEFGVNNGDIVNIEVNTNGRSVVFKDTVVRVSEKYALACHLDTDEANAAGIVGSAQGTLITL